MRIRDSGMPNESYWESLFDIPLILARLGINKSVGDVAELGCGYGTFTVPIAKAVSGTVYTFDIEQAMVDRTRQRAVGLAVQAEVRDVAREGFGVTADAVLLFNILHGENPKHLFWQAKTSLNANGRVLAIHWRHGETPRGPALNIRPRAEQIIEWAEGLVLDGGIIDLPPWHYGLSFRRPGLEKHD